MASIPSLSPVPGVVAVQTAPRPTPTPVRVRFAEVLAGGARALVQGAQAAMSTLPGAPLVAVALRGPVPRMTVGMGALRGGPSVASSLAVGTSPEGPGGAGPPGPAVAGALAPADGGLESAMAQSEQMNLYYLQIQEEVNAQNRTFTALSNVLEVEHSTAKTAIGNIH
jgi:hypothetical protein